jgi:hypothetical protein
MYSSAMGAMPPSGPPAPPMPPDPAASAPPTPMSAPGPMPSAEHQHRKKADDFARQAIVAFLTGKITRQHLADALADESAYDFPKWAAAGNVIHPSQAGIGAGTLPEPSPAAPAA